MNSILSKYSGNLPFSAQERDIDLLLIEQLHVSDEFAQGFNDRLGLSGASVVSARHSVYREHGETDVLLIVDIAGHRVAVMIGDKIGAPMQPEQCERYHLRGRALCEKGEVDRYITVLFAPEGYLSGVEKTKPWDFRISFEEVGELVRATAFPGWEWKQAVLTAAAGKQTRAREADNRSNKAFDVIIAPLKQAYRAFVLAQFPILKASKQEGRDREYYLGAVGLPAGIRFKHAFFRGEVSLIFERAWAAQAETALTGQLPDGYWAVQHGSEYHIRTAVEVMDPSLPFEQQEETAAAALSKVMSLLPLAEIVAEGTKS